MGLAWRIWRSGDLDERAVKPGHRRGKGHDVRRLDIKNLDLVNTLHCVRQNASAALWFLNTSLSNWTDEARFKWKGQIIEQNRTTLKQYSMPSVVSSDSVIELLIVLIE